MKLNRFIDHTLLKPDATRGQVKKLCEEAAETAKQLSDELTEKLDIEIEKSKVVEA